MVAFKQEKSTLVDLKINKFGYWFFVDFLGQQEWFFSFNGYQSLQTQYNDVYEKALSLEILPDTFNVTRKHIERVLKLPKVKNSEKKRLIGHSFTERIRSKIRKQHNKIEFFKAMVCFYENFAN